jgi:hypothetical protein
MLVIVRHRRWIAGVALSAWCGAAAAATAGNERVFAGAVPGGAVRVLVVVADGPWPAGGLRIEDAAGAVLLAHVEADPNAYAELDAASQGALGALHRASASGAADANTASAVRALRLLSDWTFARAAGAGVELPAALHPKSVRVVLLNAAAEPAATLGPVTVQTDGGPPAPTALRATATASGVRLQWQTAASAATVPAYGYTVERSAGGDRDLLTRHALLLGLDKPGVATPFVDHAPPVETTVGYALRLVDVLGVPSAAATAEVYSPDFAAGAPPAGQVASAGKGVVTLSWTPAANSRARGLVVERAALIDGPYELLTPDGLSPQTARFEDRQVLPGAGYYYRVRAVTPGGALGPAADPVRARPLAASALPAPQGLVADVGTSQVSLRWQPVPGVALAGYIVERRATAAAPRWARLNSRLDPDTRYLDVVGPSAGGSFEYRVTAVASDEGVGAPSEVVRVALTDSVPPAAPVLLAASGTDGRVQIRFAAAEPVERTAQVALLRAESALEEGLVVGAPVAATAGSIGDDWVQAGRAYWYRLVAFDKAGNRGAETSAVEVRVAGAALPAPNAPAVVYAAQPAPRVTIDFDPPPPHARVIVEVERDDGAWRKVVGPMSGTSAVDLDPPGPHAKYRLVYVGENGGAGAPSAAATAK